VIDIRPEHSADAPIIGALITAAFKTAPHSSGTEAAIVDGLRAAGALGLSLVALVDGAIVGHVAFSPVRIDGRPTTWFGLGPVCVRPDRQRTGIGGQLIRTGLDRLKERGAGGCVLLGDPAYYRRFGFRGDTRLRYSHAPAEFFQRLAFAGPVPAGLVEYHGAFSPS
jgi:putative acetyltransferase